MTSFSTSPTAAATAHSPSQLGLLSVPGVEPITQTVQKNTSISALGVATKSLELALHTLSERLTFLSTGQSPPDPVSIALTAEAIGKVTAALAQVKQLHWSESRVGL